jgi:membrane protein implicated in regulation of membrane protease activity
MTLELLPALGPVAVVLFVGLVLLHRRIYRFTRRPPGQVIAYLRAANLQEVGHLLDPVAEQYLRLNLTKQQFRKEQRNRMLLALEYIGRLSHNARIMAEWGYYELKRTRRTRIAQDHENATELLSASVQVRMCSFVLRATIHVWLVRVALLPFLRPPSVAKLIDAGSTDLLDFYQKMKDAAAQLSQSYGDLYHEKMTEALQRSAAS